MVFKCQEDSYLKEFIAKVVSCEETTIDEIENGKKSKTKAYEVILEDTILFPEGGGQPCDHGLLNNEPVKVVTRRGDKAVHYTKNPFNIGDVVTQKIDWDRRFDHMQQHSGQHLISAVLEKEFNFPTLSWWLGEEVSYVELDTAKISTEQIEKAENIVNGYIREGRSVSVNIVDENTPEEELKEARSSRGLPADHVGAIRVIKIDNVDENMCCGTHVTNLSQLQVIKLLHFEKSKRKDKTLLYFLIGNRVIRRFNDCLKREQKLTGLLNSNPASHPELVEKLQKNVKNLSKNLQTLLKEVAVFKANKLKNENPPPKYFALHKKEAEPDFMAVFLREFNRTDVFLFLSTGDEKGVGNIVLYGDEKAISDLGNRVCELLAGKGVGKGNKFQAKVTAMVNRPKVLELIKDYFK